MVVADRGVSNVSKQQPEVRAILVTIVVEVADKLQELQNHHHAGPILNLDIGAKLNDVAPDQPSFITGLRSPFGPIWTGLQTRSG